MVRRNQAETGARVRLDTVFLRECRDVSHQRYRETSRAEKADGTRLLFVQYTLNVCKHLETPHPSLLLSPAIQVAIPCGGRWFEAREIHLAQIRRQEVP